LDLSSAILDAAIKSLLAEKDVVDHGPSLANASEKPVMIAAAGTDHHRPGEEVRAKGETHCAPHLSTSCRCRIKVARGDDCSIHQKATEFMREPCSFKFSELSLTTLSRRRRRA
jgi:hypothetical protein